MKCLRAMRFTLSCVFYAGGFGAEGWQGPGPGEGQDGDGGWKGKDGEGGGDKGRQVKRRGERKESGGTGKNGEETARREGRAGGVR